jgi:predicted nucleic acid-binding protein
MTLTFADSFYYFALLNRTDAAHRRAVEATLRIEGRILTTDWILTELGDGMAAPNSRAAFLRTVAELRADPEVSIVRFDSELFEAGLQLFAARADKDWSLTDCISFVVMQRHGITDALTGDHHFEQAGFRALLK